MKDVYVPYMKGSSTDWYDIALGIDFFRQYDYVTLNFKEMFMMIE